MIKAKFVWAGGTETICELDLNAKLAKYFAVHEIANQSAKDEIKYVSTPRHRKFLSMCDNMRDIFGAMKVDSCYRTKSFNDALKGADPKSCHMRGEALDWWVGNVPAAMRKKVRDAWEQQCIEHREIGAINYYTHGFHLEIGSDISYGSHIFTVRDYRGTKNDW